MATDDRRLARWLTLIAIAFMLGVVAISAVGVVTGHPDFGWVLSLVALGFGCVVIAVAWALPPSRQLEPEPPSSVLVAPEPEFHYELGEPIGSGQMGTVHRARHKTLARPVAIKSIKPGSVDVEDLARFKREARAIAALYSPHTVALYDFGTRPDGSLYYVMELLTGVDLQRLVEQHGALPVERVVHVLRQICHSLEEAHDAGLVHRDLKPSNVMLCRYGLDADFVKVVDFGLVKGWGSSLSAATTEIALTKEHTVLGTPAYLAPESLKGSSKVGPAADIYALGCIAFWLLTARLVFAHDQPLQMAGAHASETPSAPSLFAPAPLPQELDALVLACLDKQPERRPSAGGLLVALERLPLARQWTRSDARQWWLAEPGRSG